MLLAFVVIGVSLHPLKADVIVFDANPSYIFSNENFFLDVDNNGVNDYELAITTSGTSMTFTYTIDVTGINNNEIETDGSGKAIALNDGAPVGNNSFESSATIIQYNTSGYYFSDNSTKSPWITV